MHKILNAEQAELAPPLEEGQPEQTTAVFVSNAECRGASLNNVLLRRPDLNSILLGAIAADVQKLFYCFVVGDVHRDDYCWYEDSEVNKNMAEFANTSSLHETQRRMKTRRGSSCRGSSKAFP